MMALPPNERILKEWGVSHTCSHIHLLPTTLLTKQEEISSPKKIKNLNFFWILGFMPFF